MEELKTCASCSGPACMECGGCSACSTCSCGSGEMSTQAGGEQVAPMPEGGGETPVDPAE